MSPTAGTTSERVGEILLARSEDLVATSPADVVVGDLVAWREISDGVWHVRPVIERRDGEHDPKWGCRKHEILVAAGPDEDSFYGQPEKLPLLVVAKEQR
ncbi:hypothetical protein [Micromonospora sp. NPDC005652]|uniref:hypothetical protein n=1 Tax=Micromonospora sp. NPDC005652 TaxID=3157046 RepID=UPI0033EFF6CB